jgi:hypothetical protein
MLLSGAIHYDSSSNGTQELRFSSGESFGGKTESAFHQEKPTGFINTSAIIERVLWIPNLLVSEILISSWKIKKCPKCWYFPF